MSRAMRRYVLGFVLSVVLTLAAYYVVVWHLIGALPVILALGFVQTLVQLVLFLHLGDEEKPRLNLTVFLFMLMVLVIIVVGSMWIMYHLNYNLM